MEDRVARANRHGPHQFNSDEMVAGVTEVEYYREVAGDPGWRGPALLLRIDQGSGTAVFAVPGIARASPTWWHFASSDPTRASTTSSAPVRQLNKIDAT